MKKRPLVVLLPLIAILLSFSSAVSGQTTTFSYAGAVQTYTVPCGITSVVVDAQGAKGGFGYNSYSRGGYGGRVVCTLAVTPGQVLYVNVGSAGGNGTSTVAGAAGFNGGVTGYTYGGGSGGASDIRIGGTALSDRVLVAGGGGGGGYNSSSSNYERGGAGGGLAGEKGFGGNINTNNYGGFPGLATNGGAGSTYTTPNGGIGSLGAGGAGGYYGGGGGGGYYGGGGGCYGGGGGGSSYTDPTLATSVTHTQGYNSTGNGSVVITTIDGITAIPGSLDFMIPTTVGTASAEMTASLWSNVGAGPMTITPPAGFEVSLDGTTWSSSAISYSFSGTCFSDVALHVRHNPSSIGINTGAVTLEIGSTTYSLSVSGAGAVACSGIPTAGTAVVSPTTGDGSTPFTASLSGTTLAGGLAFQWQSSGSPTTGFTDIAGATNPSYSFNGISNNTYYRALVTCPSYTPGISSTASASYLATFAYTGGVQTYTVPCGVSSLYVDMQGARGGYGYNSYSRGGYGGRTVCSLAVTPGQVLYINVGGAGGNGTSSIGGSAGYNGGSVGYTYGGGSGGASDIRIGGAGLSNRVVVAGGGGGGGYNSSTADYEKGGAGGDIAGEKGFGGNSNTTVYGGLGGTLSYGGAGSTYAAPYASAGAFGLGGNGGYYGGGGGGGYYGGGGGSNGGGGGGSSYADPAITSAVSFTRGYNASGHGIVTIMGAGSGLITTAGSMAFGVVAAGSLSPVMTTTLSATEAPAGGSLTITPPSGFEVSLDGATWSSTALNYTYSGASISGAVLYVRFHPSTAVAYTGAIDITGGPAFCGINVTGVGAAACSETPVAGTAWISPGIGNATTAFTTSLVGASVAGGLTYQWQSSASPSSGFTNIAGATNPTYSFSGMSATTYFRAVVTCPSFAPAVSNTVVAASGSSFGYTGNIGTYVVPADVTTLGIVVKGAQGGNSNIYNTEGGKGAVIQGNFGVYPGQVLKYIVGQQAASATYAAGGGGGTFVWDSATNTPLIIAGGGGGAGNGVSKDASMTTSGTEGSYAGVGGGGTAGNGGTVPSPLPSTYYAGAGAGWLSNGVNSNYITCASIAQGGTRPLAGGAGGMWGGSSSTFISAGGFGGGGGAQGNCSNLGAGGGGGYSGGAPGVYSSSTGFGGGGGGSLNTGSSQLNSVGNAGDGMVIFTPVGECSTPFSQPTSFSYNSTLYTINCSFVHPTAVPMAYLVVMTDTDTPPAAPQDGIGYALGDASLGGVVVSNSSSNSFSLSGIAPETKKYFWIYSFNNMCLDGPKYLATSPLHDSAATQDCGLSGVKTVGPGGDYTTIAAALTDANTRGVHGTLALELMTSYTGETYPITLRSTYPCLSATNNIVIRPQGTMTVSAAYAGPLFRFDGARYITIDGRVGSTGTARALTIVNTNTANPVIQFINDAMYDTVAYCVVRSANTSSSTSTAGSINFSTTNALYGNDYNVIESCDIAAATTTLATGIYSYGTNGKENSYNTISNCNIHDYFYVSSYNFAINLNSYNNNWIIKDNHFYQTDSRTYTGAYYNGAIYIAPGATANSSGFVITNNVIGFASESGTGVYTTISNTSDYFRGIWTNVGVSEPTVIYGNTISGLAITESNTSATSGGAIAGILHAGGSANIDSNIIGAATGNDAISATIQSSGGTFVGIATAASNPSVLTPAVVNIRKNTIGSITVKGSSTTIAGAVQAIQASQSASVVISDNIIGSTTTANSIWAQTINTSGAQYVYGINSTMTSGATPLVINNNIIANLRGSGTSTSNLVAGIVHASGSASVTITGNQVYSIDGSSGNTVYSTQLSVVGILCNPSSTLATAAISGNMVCNIANNNTSSAFLHVAGILFATATDATITRNKIYGIRNTSALSSATAPPTATGIFIYSAGGGTANSLTVANNMVTLGTGEATNTSFTGIMANNGSSSSYVYRIYHNTVVIEGTAPASAANHTAAFMRGAYNNTNLNTIDVRNNIFSNTRTNTSGTANHYAIANGINYSASATGWASDYNILNSANANTVGFYSNATRTMATWKTAALSDYNSTTGAALAFANTATGDLHIDMGTTPTEVESRGTNLPGITTDYDDSTRPGPVVSLNGGGFAPDLGADEFDGNPIDNNAPSIVYTALTNSCGTGNRTFDVKIVDPAGVPVTGALMPRLYYRKNSGTWYSSQGSLTSGTSTDGVWTFTVVASDMGGLVANNTVQYFVVAQDNNGYVGSNTSGLIATGVSSISSYPTTAASTYTVMPALGGSYNVGSGGDYVTITSAVAAYNTACLTGPVTFNLISPTYATETYPITINKNSFASETNTLTIRPADGVAATVNGPSSANSIFKLLDARWVTIDGRKADGSNLTLNSVYTSTFANVWLSSSLSSVSTTPSGCRNITLKNLDIVGGSNTATSYGILSSYNAGSTPSTTTGVDNDSITIEGNNISKCYYGIYLTSTSATSVGGYDNWTIRGNNIGPSEYSATNNIYMYGIYLSNVIGPKIIGNTLQNIGVSTASAQVRAINLSSNVDRAEISGNTIRNISASYGSDYSAPVCGIYVGSSVQNCSILGNVITGIENLYASGSGTASGITTSTGQHVSNLLIANNMISGIRAKGASGSNYLFSGINIYGSTGGVKIYHNSINLFGDYAGYNAATGSAGILISTSYSNIDIRNNMLSNTFDNITSATDKGYAIYSNQGTSGTFSNIDNNNYYVTGSNVLGYVSSDRTSLAAMQAGFGGNMRSVSLQPAFIDTTNLHLRTATTSLQFQLGVPLSEVTKDIDDTLRSTVNPVLGAHEVKVPLCNNVTLNAGTISPATPLLCTQGNTTIETVGGTDAIGLTYQWLSSEDSVTWTAEPSGTSRSFAIQKPISATTFYRLRMSCSIDPTHADSATGKVIVNPSKILGASEICAGSVTTLSDTTAGGIWSSSAADIATVGAATGVVSGLAAGTARITYTVTSSGCYATRVVTVKALPAGITGSRGVCENATTTLASLSPGGTWSSSAPSVCTIGAGTGVVSAVSVGYSYITYAMPNGCVRIVQASVNPVPVVNITPSASASLCIGDVASFKATTNLPEYTLLDQNFNSDLGAWQIESLSGGASSVWQINTTGYNDVTGDGTPMLISIPEIDGGGNNTLTSPSFSTVGFEKATLTFNQDLLSSDVDDIQVAIEYSTNDGASWSVLLDELNIVDNPGTWTASSPQVTHDLPADALNKPDVKLRWRYNTTFGYRWAIDNIMVKAILPAPAYTWATLGSASPLSCTGCDSVSVTPTAPGVNIYSVTATTAMGCASAGGVVTLTANTPPGAIAGTQVVCEGANTTLTNPVAGGVWSSGDVTKATINNVTGVVTGIAAGTANITYEMLSGCRVFAVVTVNAVPAALTGVTNVCVGATTSLNTTSADGTWSSNAPAIASVDASGVVTGAGPGVAVISYTNSNNCFAATNVTVNQSPAAITASALNVCEGQSINLSNASTGGTWASSNEAVATVGVGSGIVTGVAAGGTVPATATITYKLPGGCVSTQDIIVDPAPLPISGPSAVCQNATISLSSTTPGGSWSVGSSFVASVDAAGNVAGLNAGATAVTYTLLNGCKTTFNVSVNQIPGAITGQMQACEGTSTTLSNNVAGGTWSSSDPMVAGISALGVANAVAAGNTEITYALPTGCRSTAWVTVNAQPSAIAGTKFMCQGATTSLSSTPLGGAWTTSTPDIAVVDASGVVTGSPVNSGTATITYTLPEGCRVTTQVTVTLLPAAISGTLAVCEGSTTTLASASAGGTWSASNGNVTISAAGIVSGVTAGTAEIVYGYSPACSQSAVVTVNMTPADITGTIEICQGGVTTLASATPDGTWAIGSSFIASAGAATGVITGINAGGTSVSYTLANGCKATANFVVNQLPAPVIGTMAVCEGSITTLSSTTPGGTWTAANAHATIDADGRVNGVTAGTTEVVYALSTGCSQSAVVTVNVTPADITGTAELCQNATTTLASATPDGSWSTGSTLIASVDAASGVVTANTAGSTAVVYTLPNGCKTTSGVVVNPLPATISGVLRVCEGSETTLSNTLSGGTWVSADPATAEINNMGVVTGHIAGTVYITYEMSTGCSRSAVVTVNALPAAIAGASSVCESATAIVTNPGTGGVWSTTAVGIVDITATSGTITGLSAGTAQITYALATGCQVTADFTVLPAPAPITGTMQVCQGEITTLASTTPDGTWSTDMPGVATVNTLGEVSGTTAGYANITYTLPSGCQQAAMVTVKGLPVAYPVGGGGSYCAGDPGVNVTLTFSQSGVDYQLYNGTTAVGTAVSGTDAPINFGLQTTTGAYTVKAVSTVTGCANDMFGAATVAIAPAVVPAVSLFVPGGTTICGGTAATYNATPVNGGTLPAYAWEVNGAPVAGATSASYSYVPANGDIVKVTLTSSAACASPVDAVDIVTMVVNTPVTPAASIAGPSSVCKGDPATMTVTSTNGGTSPSLQWYVNGTAVPAATSSAYTFVPDAGDYVYCTMATSIACNSAAVVNSNTMALLTNPVFVPTVGLSVSPGVSVESGTPVTFSTIVSGGGAAPVYQWFINGTPVAGETNSTFVSATLRDNDSVTCRVTATEICGHETFNSTLMTVKPTVGTVTVNSRNSDLRLAPNPNTGVFTISGHLSSADNETVALEITNVLGQTVYSGSLIAKGGQVNGQVKLPKELANGMYLVSMKTAAEQHVLRFVLEQ